MKHNLETITAMREWVEDCAVDEDDLEDRQAASDEKIVRYVAKQYCGGVKEFLKTIN